MREPVRNPKNGEDQSQVRDRENQEGITMSDWTSTEALNATIRSWRARAIKHRAASAEAEASGDHVMHALLNTLQSALDRNAGELEAVIKASGLGSNCRCSYTLWTDAKGCNLHDPGLASIRPQPKEDLKKGIPAGHTAATNDGIF